MTFAKDAGLNQTAERRQITVMFCDLVDSVSLSQRCDPEDLRSIIHLYHRECGATIARNQGQVVQFLGDGIMAQFGFPLAAEDSARAAVRAALAFRAVLPALNEKLANAHGEQIRFRIGLAGIVMHHHFGTIGAKRFGDFRTDTGRATCHQNNFTLDIFKHFSFVPIIFIGSPCAPQTLP